MALTATQRRAIQAWGAAHTSLGDAPEPDVLNQVIQWAREDPRFVEENTMQRQWTIQLRFDPLGEDDKKDYMTTLVIRVASHLLAQAQLLEGPVQSNISVYSDDFFKKREEIELVPDTIGAALKAYGVDEQEGLSAEMQEVVSGLNRKRAK